jgi:hypothetical protein
VLRNAAGTIFQPIYDACDGNPNDLAFALTSRAIVGTVTPPGGFDAANVVLQAQLRDLQTGELLESIPVEVYDNDMVFDFEVWPEYTSGDFLLELHGMGAIPLQATITLESGTETVTDFTLWSLGDLSGDGHVRVEDLGILLPNYGM